MNTRRFMPRALLAAAALAGSLGTYAQAWPDKAVKFIVPLPPGGPSDIVLRSALEKMQGTLKQPLVLENKPGAAGNLGAGEAARAAADGYTWLFTTDTLFTVNPHVYDRLPFKTSDLQPVMRASAWPTSTTSAPASPTSRSGTSTAGATARSPCATPATTAGPWATRPRRCSSTWPASGASVSASRAWTPTSG